MNALETLEDGTLVVTTETSRGIRRSIRILLLFNGMGACVVLIAPQAGLPVTWFRVQALASVLLMFFGLSVCLCFLLPRGTWRLGPLGIEREPRLGRRQSLRWDEVQAVLWAGPTVVLHGAGATIAIPFSVLDRDVEGPVRLYLEKRLAREFDLRLKPARDRPAGRHLDRRGKILRSLQLVGVAAGFTASLLGSRYAVGEFFPDPAGWSVLAWGASWSGLLLLALSLAWRRSRAGHPRWRTRRLD